MELKNIEFEEAYEVELPKAKGFSFFTREEDEELEALSEEKEETAYMIQMKLKLYYKKIQKEEQMKTKLLNEQRANVHKICANCLIIAVFCVVIILIEKFAQLSKYTRLSDISIFDLKSIGAICIYPATILFFMGIVVCLGSIIVLFIRSAVTEDPHDKQMRRRETILKRCDEKINLFNEEIYKLQMKLLNIK